MFRVRLRINSRLFRRIRVILRSILKGFLVTGVTSQLLVNPGSSARWSVNSGRRVIRKLIWTPWLKIMFVKLNWVMTCRFLKRKWLLVSRLRVLQRLPGIFMVMVNGRIRRRLTTVLLIVLLSKLKFVLMNILLLLLRILTVIIRWTWWWLLPVVRVRG